MYKPKDLRLDVAWHAFSSLEPLRATAPIAGGPRDGPRQVRLDRFIDHTGCADQEAARGFSARLVPGLRYFTALSRRTCTKRTLLQRATTLCRSISRPFFSHPPQHGNRRGGKSSFDAAAESSPIQSWLVGLLPAYGRSPDNSVFAMGGLTADWNSKSMLSWRNINTDEMRPAKMKVVDKTNPNLPHVGGRYARFSEYIDAFISGFEDYAKFLVRQQCEGRQGNSVRGLYRRSGPQGRSPHAVLFHAAAAAEKPSEHGRRRIWSAQADFIARFADGRKLRSHLAVSLRRTSGPCRVERAAFRVAERQQ